MDPQVTKNVLLTPDEAGFVWRLLLSFQAIPGTMLRTAAGLLAKIEAAAEQAIPGPEVGVQAHKRRPGRPRKNEQTTQANGSVSEAEGAAV